MQLWHKFILFCFLILASTLVFADHHYTRYESTELEIQLDEAMANLSRGEHDLSGFYAVFEKVKPNTPILTRTRAYSFYILEASPFETEQEYWDATAELIKEAERSGVVDAIVDARLTLVSLHYYTGNTQDALVELEQIERLLSQLESIRVRYIAHFRAGQIRSSVGDYENSLEHYLLAAEAVAEMDNDLASRRRLFVTEGIARVQSNLRHYDSALDYTKQVIADSEKDALEVELPRLYLFKGYLENMLGLSEASIKSHEAAIQWARKYNFGEIILLSMNNIGSSLIEQERYDEAKVILNEAVREAEQYEDIATLTILNFNLSYIEVMVGNTEEGIAGIEAVADAMRKQTVDSEYIDVLKYMGIAYETAGDYKRAVEVMKEERELQKTLATKARDKALEELQTRYRANEQAIQIQLLEQRNQTQESDLQNAKLQKRIFMLFILVVALTSVLLFLAWRASRTANIRLKTVNQELEYQSTHDPLTGLLNRRSFQTAMTNRLRQSDSKTAEQHPDALLLLDIDYFKKINDKIGHAAGDKVLIEVAKRLKKISRSTDMVVRWGGEEFLIYLREMDPNHLAEYTQEVLKALGAEPVKLSDRERRVTATAGFISLPFSGFSEARLDWERCLQIADMALYIGKVQGRNQGLGVMALLVDTEEAEHALENDLSGAIEKGWVRVKHVNGPDV